MTNPDTDFLTAIKRAESLVASLADEKLRAVAFEIVLQRIIGEGDLSQPRVSTEKARTQPRAESHEQPRVKPSRAKNGPSAWVEDLHKEGFFSTPKTITDVVAEVRSRGHHVASKDVTFPLVRLVDLKRVRRRPGQSGKSQREVWVYTNF